MIYHFYLKRMKIVKIKKHVANLHDKKDHDLNLRNLK